MMVTNGLCPRCDLPLQFSGCKEGPGGLFYHVNCDFLPPKEDVTKPSHYKRFGEYEPFKVIHAWKLGYHLGDALAYIARAAHKGSQIEDLKKAVVHIQEEIKLLEEMTKP